MLLLVGQIQIFLLTTQAKLNENRRPNPGGVYLSGEN
jgi:hypothetical protein